MIYRVTIRTNGSTSVVTADYVAMEKVCIAYIWWENPDYIFATVYISALNRKHAVIKAEQLTEPYRKQIGRESYTIYLKPAWNYSR